MRLILLIGLTATLASACGKRIVNAFPENFVGVGVELTVRNEAPVVVRTIDGGPAATAGIQPNDRLVAINDFPVTGMGLPDVVLRLRGEEGSTVDLTLVRGDERIRAQIVRQSLQKAGGDYAMKHQ